MNQVRIYKELDVALLAEVDKWPLDYDRIDALLKQGADIHVKDEYGYSILGSLECLLHELNGSGIKLSEEELLEPFEFFLKRGHEPNGFDKHRYGILLTLIFNVAPKLLELCLRYGADANFIPDDEPYETLLDAAEFDAWFDYKEGVSTWLDAYHDRQIECIELLKQYGGKSFSDLSVVEPWLYVWIRNQGYLVTGNGKIEPDNLIRDDPDLVEGIKGLLAWGLDLWQRYPNIHDGWYRTKPKEKQEKLAYNEKLQQLAERVEANLARQGLMEMKVHAGVWDFREDLIKETT